MAKKLKITFGKAEKYKMSNTQTFVWEDKEYDIEVVKVAKNVYIAKCEVLHKGHPFKVDMAGKSEIEAVKKLIAFFQ